MNFDKPVNAEVCIMTETLLPDAQVGEISVDVLSGKRWSLSARRPANFTMIVFIAACIALFARPIWKN